MKKIITSKNIAPAIGPYSQAVDTGDFVFLSGQIALPPAGGALVGATAAEQAEQVLQNIQAVLAEAGLTLENIVKASMFLQDLGDFAAVNAVYGKYFTSNYPARSTFQVAKLPLGALVEIEVIAKR